MYKNYIRVAKELREKGGISNNIERKEKKGKGSKIFVFVIVSEFALN